MPTLLPAPRLLRRQLATFGDDASLTRFLQNERARLMDAWTPPAGGLAWMRAHSLLIDETVRRLFTLAVERAGAQGQSVSPRGGIAGGIAIVATGGYGRRELSPHSDLDITFLPARDDDPLTSRVIKEMFRLVMDVFLSGAKIKVGYAYRLLSDHDGLDHQTQTALLDARCVAGDETLFAHFDQKFRARLQPTDFVFRKYAERNATLDKGRSPDGTVSPYNVEPNLKEGAGGLRDLQSAMWVAHVRYNKRGGDALWRDLGKRNVVTEAEAARAQETREFLFRVRNLLHLSAGEAKDALTAERQEAVAARLGYVDDDARHVPGVEQFMRDYYHHVAGLHHVANKILVRCLDSPLPLGSGLASVARRVTVWQPAEAAEDPLWPFKALRACQTYDLDLALTTEEAIQRHVRETLLPGRENDPERLRNAGALLLEILSHPRNVNWAARQMQRTGLLAYVLPALDACMDLIPYDPAHEHTVGEHSLLVLRNLERVRNSSQAETATSGENLLPYRHLMEEVNAPEALYLAALLHDVGKQWPGGRHAETGAEYASEWCERLGCPPHIIDHVTFLIRHHLLMAETSRLRDLALDETVGEFVRAIPDMERLRMLYLLTFADTQAVGAGVWTEVKARFLAELFGRAEIALAASTAGDAASEQAPQPGAPDVQAFRERVRRQLGRAENKTPPEAIHEHTVAMPASYLLNTSPDDMFLHIALIARVRDTFKPLVDSRTPFGSNYTELTVVAYDDPKPGLLAKIAAVLYAHDVNLHSAQVFTRTSTDRIAIDTLWVDYRDRPLTPAKRRECEDTLRQVLSGETTAAALLTRRGKRADTVQPVRSLALDDATSPHYSILDVQTPDQRGVFYRVTSAVSQVGWNIHSARLSTWRGSTRNAFYLTDIKGDKIPAHAVHELDASLPHEHEAAGANGAGTLLRARTTKNGGAARK